MKINFLSELDMFNHGVCGVETSLNNNLKILENNNIDYVINNDLNDDSNICHFQTVFLINLKNNNVQKT